MSDTDERLAARPCDNQPPSARVADDSIAEHAPVGIFQTDAQGECLFVNRRWCELAGLTPAEAHGTGWVRALHPEDHERVLREWDEAARLGREFQSEYRFCTADGRVSWLSGNAKALHDATGRLTGFVGTVTDISQRKAMEESMLAKEAQLRLVTEHATVFIAHCGKDLRFKFVNHSYAARLGLMPEHCVGRSIPELLGRDAFESFRGYVERVLAGETLEYEVEVPYRNAGRRIMHCAYVPERNAAGEVVGWIAALADVTERRRAEEAFRHSEQRFARFMQHLPGLAWIKDMDGRYLFANDAAVRAFNVARERLYGKTDAEIFPPHTAIQFQQHDRRALASQSGALQTIETLTHANGEVHHSLVSKFPLPDVDGKSILVAGIAFDITDRLKAEESLRQHKERLELAQQAGRIGTFDWNLQTGVIEWSATEEELYGLEPGTFGGRLEDWQQLVHPDDRRRALEECRRAVDVRRPIDTEFRILRPDGQVRSITAQARLHVDAAGIPQRMVGVNVDVTEWRAMEAALREADHRKDEFLATLAHELRNPLAPIRNALHLLGLEDNPRVVAEAREMMERQVKQMVHLIDDLLDVSRITRGTIELRKSPIELAAAVQSAVEATRPLLEGQNHRLTLHLPDEPVVLHADLTRLAQVISNLLGNAAKFTGQGGRISLSVVPGPLEVELSVADNGIGIAPEELPRIFDMFMQVDRSLERNRGGLGIGLTLVKRLVELHGGSVTAHSAGPGQGSTFRIRLPRLVTAAPAPADSAPRKTGAFAGLRVLVADDNLDSASSLAQLLRMKGIEVRTAHDGLEAVEAAEQFRPHAIVMDLGMPRLNGYEAAQRLREQPWGRGLLLIALSGWGQSADQQRSLAAGFDHHFVKPGDLARLETLLAAQAASRD